MNYRLNLYSIEDKNPTLHSTYEFNAHARPAFRKLAESGKVCFLTHVDQSGKEELFEISTATKETNQQLRQLFFLKYFLKNWTEAEQIDWLKTWIFSYAQKQIFSTEKN